VLRSAIALILGLLLPFADGGTWNDGRTHDGAVDVGMGDAGPEAGGGSVVLGGDRWVRHGSCGQWLSEVAGSGRPVGIFTGDVPVCAVDVPAPEGYCGDGEVVLEPWWRSQALAGGRFGPWSQSGTYECGADALIALIEQEWARMPITASTYVLEPATGWAIAELGVNPIVDVSAQTMSTQLLGRSVLIRALPTRFGWGADDGTWWLTTDGGRPYSEGGVPFGLAKYEHRTSVNLTTWWRGEYSLDGGVSWKDAPGVATTTSVPTRVHVYNPHTHGVDCDLAGSCLSGNSAVVQRQTLLDPDGDGIDNYLVPDNQIDAYLRTH